MSRDQYTYISTLAKEFKEENYNYKLTEKPTFNVADKTKSYSGEYFFDLASKNLTVQFTARPNKNGLKYVNSYFVVRAYDCNNDICSEELGIPLLPEPPAEFP